MVLILTNNFDPSTSDVINWLDYLGVKWIRINEDDNITLLNIEFDKDGTSNITILVNEENEIELQHISSYWYRRGYLLMAEKWRHVRFANSAHLQSTIYNTLDDDHQNAFEYIHHFLQERKRNVNSYLSAKNNKLYYLSKAIENGLSVPRSIVCSTKAELLNFYQRNGGRIISKSINEGLFGKTADHHQYYFYTNLVALSDIESSNQTFFPSLFQEYIEKFIELRIFYFHGAVSCMAEFSQLNQNTKIDIRNFDDILPNRKVPFLLPPDIVPKITKFMKSIQLNSGSLDMVVTPGNEFYFLEVNPVGQFGMVSYPCNYKLEKQLATFLKDSNER